MSGNVYGYAQLAGSGLGNMLLPWARCEIFCRQHGLASLAPRWSHFKLGPLLRGERDKRYYVGLFTQQSYQRGLSKLSILARARKIEESDAEAFMAARSGEQPGALGRPSVVLFRDLRGMFAPLLPHREFVRRRMLEILRPSLRQTIDQTPVDFVIGAHIRRGDKTALKLGQPWPVGEHHFGQPDEWFVACVQNIRKVLGYPAPVRIFSDAHDEQLTSIMALENVQRAAPNPSIVDIFLLSKSKILITTGTSSFSMWASYFGLMPTLWYPGLRVELNPDRPRYNMETSLDGELPGEFAETLKDVEGADASRKRGG
jgi:hypothetical protein